MAELYPFQKEAVAALLSGKHFVISGTGSGKSAVAMCYAEHKMARTGKAKLLIVTTASKSKARTTEGLDDFSADAKLFCSSSFFNSLSSSLTLLSWHKLAAWTKDHANELDEYVIIWDEVQKAKSGIASGMGKAFLKITKANQDWAGFTATPGDTWLSFYPYFVACGMEKNKTSFLAKYANVQTFKGFPEIVGWRNEAELKRMWSLVSYAPDTSIVAQQMPEETYRTITVSLPKAYSTVLKTRLRAGSDPDHYEYDTDFLATSGALVSELRRLCFTKDKQDWLSDFLEGVESSAVIFYNYIATGDALETIARKALPKGSRIWRIDGAHHDIPTAETIGKKDVVLCQWQSGSEALNLQFIHYWITPELCYSFSTFKQGLGRIKRIGQKHPMTFYCLICDDGIERDVLQILKGKGTFAEKNWCIEKNIEIKEG